MSKKLRRWDIECTGIGDDVDMVERPKGNYVLMEDYARLKAEVESLKEAWVDKKMQEDRDYLLQQVERLRKAGNAMAEALEAAGFDSARAFWNAAKEGKQP